MQSETSMPFFKPRFTVTKNSLALLEVPAPDSVLGVFGRSELIGELRSTDGYFSNFQYYRRCGFTPLCNFLYRFGNRGLNLVQLLRPESEDQELLIKLMSRFRSEVASLGGQTVFIILPEQQILEGGWRALLPDKYGNLVRLMRKEGCDVLDGREILLSAGDPPSDLYHRDRRHYTSRGNQILGRAVREWLGP